MYKSLIAAALILSPLASFGSIVSYDASTNALPQSPDFNHFDGTIPFFGYSAPQSVSGGIYSTGPTDSSKYTFWYANTQILDHTKTVEVSATLRLDSQTSGNPANRAGLAIGLTDDRNLYQELYIGTGEIFINTTGRVRDVSYSMDTAAFHDYTLRLSGDTITVDVDGVTRLTGAIFDASGSGLPTGANWAVVGDITSSAFSSYDMTQFSVAVVPEPATLAALGLVALLPNRRRR